MLLIFSISMVSAVRNFASHHRAVVMPKVGIFSGVHVSVEQPARIPFQANVHPAPGWVMVGRFLNFFGVASVSSGQLVDSRLHADVCAAPGWLSAQRLSAFLRILMQRMNGMTSCERGAC